MSRNDDDPRLDLPRSDADSGDAPTDAAGAPPETGPADDDVHGSPDATLGGYFRVHDRPPAFEGSDGHPYTVSIEVERTPDLRAPFEGYLVFPKWAANGLGIIGHVETETLWKGRTSEEVAKEVGELPLLRVQAILDEAILRSNTRVESPADAP